MGLLGFIQAAASLAVALTGWLHDRQLIDMATKAAWSRKLQEVNDALDRARTARDRTQLDLDRHPERLRDDDGFKRD